MANKLSAPPSPPKPRSFDDVNPETLTGFVAAVGTALPSWFASMTGGVVSLCRGREFSEGFDNTQAFMVEHLMSPVVDFADQHNEKIAGGAICGVTAAAVQVAADSVGEKPDADPGKTLLTGLLGGAAGGVALGLAGSRTEGAPASTARTGNPSAR